MTILDDMNTQFIDTLREIVKFKKNYVYTHDNCVYFFQDNSPGCLIGQVLDKMGYDRDSLEAYRADSVTDPNGESAIWLLRRMGFDERVADAAYLAQIVQDSNGTWGDALEAFRRDLERAPGIYVKHWRF